MKSLIALVGFLQISFANAALDLAGTNFIYSNTKDLAYMLKLESNGAGSIVTLDGDSAVSWKQVDDNTVSIALEKPTVYSQPGRWYIDKNTGKPIEIVKNYSLEKLEVKKYTDESISLQTTVSLAAPLAPELNKTYQEIEVDLIVASNLSAPFQISSNTDHIVLPSMSRLNDMYVSLKNGLVVDDASGLEGKKFTWNVSGFNSLTLKLENGTTINYLLAGVGPVPRALGIAENADGSKKLLSGRIALETPTSKATVQSFAGLYETVTTFESLSDMPTYQFNLDGTGGFKSVFVDDHGFEKDSGLWAWDTFWSWTVNPEGVISATQYKLPSGQPVSSMSDVQFCMNPANACTVRQVRSHKIVSETQDGILITLRKLQGFSTVTNPDGTTTTKASEPNITLWVLRKI
jgi:hypothetical protein